MQVQQRSVGTLHFPTFQNSKGNSIIYCLEKKNCDPQPKYLNDSQYAWANMQTSLSLTPWPRPPPPQLAPQFFNIIIVQINIEKRKKKTGRSQLHVAKLTSAKFSVRVRMTSDVSALNMSMVMKALQPQLKTKYWISSIMARSGSCWYASTHSLATDYVCVCKKHRNGVEWLSTIDLALVRYAIWH